MKWRVAKALLELRDQVNAAFPDRDKGWDGTIGDAGHSARTSDHNPNNDGVVCAMDITHDPDNGVDSYVLAEQLRQSQDGRIKYIISNRRIASSTQSPWKWRKYSGSNPHDHHVHVSVKSPARYYDDASAWNIPMLAKSARVAENEEIDDDSFGPSRVGIADTIGTVVDMSAKAKPLYKSRISWGAVGLGTSSVATAAAAAPPTLMDQFINIWKSPLWWLVVFNVALTIFILYHYWADHGKGTLRREDGR